MKIHRLNAIPTLAENTERGPLKHLGEVAGWCEWSAARGTDYLLRYQTARDLIGDVAEIGVYQGLYFLVLMWGLMPGETATAIDIFEEGTPAIPSEQGQLTPFMDNVRRWGPPTVSTTVIQANSTRLAATDVLLAMETTSPRPFRWISVDGSHDEESCCADLALAESLLMPGGVVALDDWRAEGNPQWPGVIDGTVRYQLTAPAPLVHIGTLPNKLLLTTDEGWAEEYRRILRDWKE